MHRLSPLESPPTARPRLSTSRPIVRGTTNSSLPMRTPRSSLRSVKIGRNSACDRVCSSPRAGRRAQRPSQGNPAGSNRARENGQIGRSTTRSGCPRVPVAVRTSRLSSREEGKAIIFTPVRESSGEPQLRSLRTPRRARRNCRLSSTCARAGRRS